MGLFTQDVGIDLGTANTLICVKGEGIVIREPSVVAVDLKTSQVVAVGTAAKDMIGRTPGSIKAVRPLKDGVIANFEVAADMLKAFIGKAVKTNFFTRTRVIICVPAGVTEVERRAVDNAARASGAKYVSIIEEPMAAAIGAKLPVSEATGSMIVDIGGGTSDIAIISLGDIVTSKTVRVAGNAFDEAIINYVKKKFKLLIGERTAEDIKLAIGSAFPYEGEGAMEIKGRNIEDGLPKNVEITSEEVREALQEPLDTIIDAVKTVLERTPPELAGDIFEKGIMITGGGALLRNIDQLISFATNMPVVVSERPLDSVVDGTLICLDNNLQNLYANRNKNTF